jgi:hypothetical protein
MDSEPSTVLKKAGSVVVIPAKSFLVKVKERLSGMKYFQAAPNAKVIIFQKNGKDRSIYRTKTSSNATSEEPAGTVRITGVQATDIIHIETENWYSRSYKVPESDEIASELELPSSPENYEWQSDSNQQSTIYPVEAWFFRGTHRQVDTNPNWPSVNNGPAQ